LFLFMTAYRLFFFFHYKPQGKAFSGSMMLLGLRFDARVLAVIGLISFFITSVFNPFINKKYKPVIFSFIIILFLIFIVSYISDFYYYDYLKQRLSAFILSFVQDASISTKMMWQTYPVVKIIIAIVAILFVFNWGLKKIFDGIENKPITENKKKRNLFSILFIFIAAVSIFGKIGQYPLRWSDAFTLSDDFKANAALNPFQSFISTFSFKNNSYDIVTVKEAYPLMADYLCIKNKESLNYARKYEAVGDTTNAKNIVIVICESFSAYKSSMYGNGLNATPYFNAMCNNGIFFERCFTPAFGTARGVWATLTGIPDVQENKTASRNPAAVNQQTIMNQFNGYEKFYFLGGSTTWANIRGLLTNNISGLKIYEEENFKAAKVDVWGISDKNLFLEANKVFATQTKPFVSIIQTADNHKPYTIPAEDLNEFKKLNYSKDTLAKYGFDDYPDLVDNNAQLNAFRYTDFCFQKFIEAAKKEKYFANTIFVFVGDHGLRGDAKNMFPKSFTAQGILAEHVPLLFYAPGFLTPKRIVEPASQLDIFPSVAALTNKSYNNQTLGVNLFDTVIQNKRYAFIADPDMHTIGVVSDSFYCGRNLNTKQINFVSVINDKPIVINNFTAKKQKDMLAIADAFYYTSKYLLLNNKK
jgi:phosphoglycerol transferase MdoB-like AlkP superfamily enzyme